MNNSKSEKITRWYLQDFARNLYLTIYKTIKLVVYDISKTLWLRNLFLDKIYTLYWNLTYLSLAHYLCTNRRPSYARAGHVPEPCSSRVPHGYGRAPPVDFLISETKYGLSDAYDIMSK